MEITSAKYNASGSIDAVLDGIEMTVPDDMSNRHRAALAEWEADGNTIEPYVEPPYVEPIPDEISRRQFFQQLAVQELITNTEALAAVQTGAIPETINAIIYSMPAESRFSAQMLVSGATVFDRNNPLSEIVRVALDWTEEQKNQFWIDAYKL